jgi:hypothetical protein
LIVDDLVKGFSNFVIAVEGDEEKCSFLRFLVVVLVEEGTSFNFGAEGGERSL